MSASLELPPPLVRSLLLSMELAGHDAAGLFQRLSKMKQRAAWDLFITALESFFATEGSLETQRLMQLHATRTPEVAVAAELLGDLRQTYVVLLEAITEQGILAARWKPGATGGLVVHLELGKTHRPSMVFFQSCAWFLAALPRARGLPDARVLSAHVTERELQCLVMFPREKANGLLLPLGEGLERTLGQAILRQEEPRGEARPSLPTPHDLQSRFGLTRAEARVVRRLAEGSSIKRIAEELRVSPETARTHAKRAMQKTDTHRQAELVSLVLQTR
ncbi:MAG: helix-turn-helix transcriptional regulator [Myxococcota bacterium]